MTIAFLVAAIIAVAAALAVVTGREPIRALASLVVSLLATALMFYTLGAPFVAGIEVVVYAGAVMMLFVFAIMLVAPPPARGERRRSRSGLLFPAALAAGIVAEAAVVLASGPDLSAAGVGAPADLAVALYRDHVVAVEVASVLLLAGLAGGFFLAAPVPLKPRGGGGDD